MATDDMNTLMCAYKHSVGTGGEKDAAKASFERLCKKKGVDPAAVRTEFLKNANKKSVERGETLAYKRKQALGEPKAQAKPAAKGAKPKGKPQAKGAKPKAKGVKGRFNGGAKRILNHMERKVGRK